MEKLEKGWQVHLYDPKKRMIKARIIHDGRKAIATANNFCAKGRMPKYWHTPKELRGNGRA